MTAGNFFHNNGFPGISRQWLNSFIPDPEMQSIYVNSEICRNVGRDSACLDHCDAVCLDSQYLLRSLHAQGQIIRCQAGEWVFYIFQIHSSLSDKTLEKDEMDNINESWRKHGSFGGRGGPPLTAIRVGIIGCG